MQIYRCYRAHKMSMNSHDNNIKNKFKKGISYERPKNRSISSKI